MPKEFVLVKELLYWSYANLAMAHFSVINDQKIYILSAYSIRAKFYKGFLDENIKITTLFEDERLKLKTSGCCNYCGEVAALSLDHIFSKKYGGLDTGDNLIYSCKNCNSSKRERDLLEWMTLKNKFPPLMILRRYLKLIIQYSQSQNLMEKRLDELENLDLPFSLKYIPTKFPQPEKLILFYG